jgi:hypothetical protein
MSNMISSNNLKNSQPHTVHTLSTHAYDMHSLREKAKDEEKEKEGQREREREK